MLIITFTDADAVDLLLGEHVCEKSIVTLAQQLFMLNSLVFVFWVCAWQLKLFFYTWPISNYSVTWLRSRIGMSINSTNLQLSSIFVFMSCALSVPLSMHNYKLSDKVAFNSVMCCSAAQTEVSREKICTVHIVIKNLNRVTFSHKDWILAVF